jgi:hypothetical protein
LKLIKKIPYSRKYKRNGNCKLKNRIDNAGHSEYNMMDNSEAVETYVLAMIELDNFFYKLE